MLYNIPDYTRINYHAGKSIIILTSNDWSKVDTHKTETLGNRLVPIIVNTHYSETLAYHLTCKVFRFNVCKSVTKCFSLISVNLRPIVSL